MKSEAAVRLEEAAVIVAALARQWREAADLDESGMIDRRHVDEIVSMTETTARNLFRLAAAKLPDDPSLEQRTHKEGVAECRRAGRPDEELASILQPPS